MHLCIPAGAIWRGSIVRVGSSPKAEPKDWRYESQEFVNNLNYHHHAKPFAVNYLSVVLGGEFPLRFCIHVGTTKTL